MTERLMESPTLAEFAKALAKAQAAMGNASKDSTNPHFKSKYADLASIRDAIRKPLGDNGMSFFQRVSSSKDGVTVETTLLHVSGEFVRDAFWIPVAQQTPQAFGSAVSYGRRYSLAALVGVVAGEEDDDGNAASEKPQELKRKRDEAPRMSKPTPEKGPETIPDAILKKKTADLETWLKTANPKHPEYQASQLRLANLQAEVALRARGGVVEEVGANG